MPLNDVLAQAIDDTRDGATVDTNRASRVALPMILADPDMTEMCVLGYIGRRIKDMVTREGDRVEEDDRVGQGDLFGLRPAHALDTEGRIIKQTDALTRMEFERLRDIRRKQIAADAAYLELLNVAAAQLGPIWDADPSLTYGEAKARWLAQRQAAE